MTSKPTSAVQVGDLHRSIGFYRDALQFEVEPGGNGVAVVNAGGWPMLLAGPDAGDITPNLSEIHATVEPGATIHLFEGDLDRRHAALSERGISSRLVETSWGDRTLILSDPDGYIVSFWTTSTRTPAQSIALYAAGPDALDAALTGLSNDDLDWKPSPNEWSIREIVHHIVDSDATALFRVKMALAEPGRVMLGNPYNPDTWAASLDYAGRDIAPGLALLRATRAHVLQLLDHLPDAMQRTVQNPQGDSTSVEVFLSMLASHLMIHIEQIKAVCRR